MKRFFVTIFSVLLAFFPVIVRADTLTLQPVAGASINYGSATTQASWTTVRNAAVGTAAVTSFSGFQIQLYTSTSTINPWRNLVRAFLTFDTSAIPDNAVINSVQMRLYGNSKFDGLGVSTTMGIAIVSSTPVNPIAYNTGDYSRIDGIVFASTTYQNFLTGGYNDFNFNTTSTINKTTYTTFGVREYRYDHQNVEPPTTTLNNNTNINISATTSNPVYLVIDYSVPPEYVPDSPPLTSTNSTLLADYVYRYGRALTWIISGLLFAAFVNMLYTIGINAKRNMRSWF